MGLLGKVDVVIISFAALFALAKSTIKKASAVKKQRPLFISDKINCCSILKRKALFKAQLAEP